MLFPPVAQLTCTLDRVEVWVGREGVGPGGWVLLSGGMGSREAVLAESWGGSCLKGRVPSVLARVGRWQGTDDCLAGLPAGLLAMEGGGLKRRVAARESGGG